MNNKYIQLKNEYIAKAITAITGEKFMVFNDIKDPTGKNKIYSFKNTKKIRLARFELNELIEKFKNEFQEDIE